MPSAVTDPQEVFLKIKDLLSKHTSIKVDELDNGNHLTIDQTEIWIEVDDKELTIGYGLSHIHYDPKYDNIKDAVELFFNLLTKRKRITLYLKGNKIFKEKADIELEENKYKNIGVATTMLFPFWKKTTTRITFDDPLLKHSDIESEIKEIYKLT